MMGRFRPGRARAATASGIVVAMLGMCLAVVPRPAEAMVRQAFGGGRVGQFRGYTAFNEHLRARLLDPGDDATPRFAFARFLGESFPSDGGLASLLGGYSGDGNANDFRNGTPNAVNMLLWHIGAHAMAEAVSQTCVTGKPTFASGAGEARLAEPVFAALQGFCEAGSDPSARGASLRYLWLSFHGFDLPREEFAAYVDFFANDPALLALPAQAQAQQALAALFMHPLFLLER